MKIASFYKSVNHTFPQARFGEGETVKKKTSPLNGSKVKRLEYLPEQVDSILNIHPDERTEAQRNWLKKALRFNVFQDLTPDEIIKASEAYVNNTFKNIRESLGWWVGRVGLGPRGTESIIGNENTKEG